MGYNQVQPLQSRMDMGVMAMKENSSFCKAIELEPHYQMFLCHTQDTRWEGGSFISVEIQFV